MKAGFDPEDMGTSKTHRREEVRICPFCGEYCHISGSFERVHYVLLRVGDDEPGQDIRRDTQGEDQGGEGDNNPEARSEAPCGEDYMRTSSILHLKTKAKYPWRTSHDGAEETSERRSKKAG